ncbi:hypothetical protein GFS24_12285 [Chitinophaga sp. SYP-B3965]|uniref:hypothetical protein n=1 Tax=Chitinophaga sp. SYP-B3965 TaxID=2663120 RepID=UPI0012999104|nr:hypothetical protein [Chitinophaga sp. SYP-B3965]MRG45899.1 hypothetical protein [Chitinophaga sp. SYP-B3965]
MRKLLLALAIIATSLFATQSAAATPTMESPESTALYQKKAKTVRVKSYKTKSGKTVKSYKRSKPSKKRS